VANNRNNVAKQNVMGTDAHHLADAAVKRGQRILQARAARVARLPAGGGEAFFWAAGRTAEREGLPPAAPPDIENLKRAGAIYESEIVGPPMAPKSAKIAESGV